MIVNSDAIIKNKPKDCKLCPAPLCADMTVDNLHIYYNYKNDTAIYPPCVYKETFKVIHNNSNVYTIKDNYTTLINAIDAMLESIACDLEMAVQLTKIRNMI